MLKPVLSNTRNIPNPILRNFLCLALLLPMLVACIADGESIDVVISFDSPDEPTALINTPVQADVGGTFTSSDGRITVRIPAEAITEDSTLVVTEVEGLTHVTENQSPAGDAFAIEFGTTLAAPAELELVTELIPQHPELAESAEIVDGEWVGTAANFYRASDNSILSFINGDGTYQAIIRTLQAETGDMVERGRDVFLNATFGNEDYFGSVVRLQDLLNNLPPSAAVGAGVQIDISRVPAEIVAVLTGDDFDAIAAALENPAVTRALLKADAVVGVKAFFDDSSSDFASSAGVTCAICHAVVTPTAFELSEGVMTDLPIGPLQLDGKPNTDMDIGLILSLTPFAIEAGQDTIDTLQSWGPGRADARALPDNPADDNLLNPTSTPPIWNFVDLAEQDYTYNWDGLFGSLEDPDNALASRGEFVHDLVLSGNGAFGTDASTVPLEVVRAPAAELVNALIAAEDTQPGNDIPLQPTLDLQAWQRSIVSPAPGEFNEALAEEGFRLFYGFGQCSNCHLTPEFTGPVRTAAIVLEPPLGVLAEGIKTPGLRGIYQVPPYFHDDSAQTLEEVVQIYSGRIVNELNDEQQQAIVEYMKSL